MSGWTPVWSMIVDSSLWEEPDYVCKVFLTMLAIKDHDHIVRLDPYKLAKKSHKTEQEVIDALKVLSSPDTRRLSPQEFEGRRIEKVEDGWLMLNGEKYRRMMSRIQRREYQAEWQRGYRDRQKQAGEQAQTSPPTDSKLIGEGPLIEDCLKWLEDVRKNGADYTEKEMRTAWLSLNANGWMWGKNPVTDWRSALEARIQQLRKNPAEKKKKFALP